MNKNARSIEKARNRTQIRFTEDSGVHSAAERIRQHKAVHSLRGDSSRPVAPQRSTTQPSFERKKTEDRRDSDHRFSQFIPPQRMTTMPDLERKKSEHSVKRGDHHAKSKLKDWILAAKKKWQKKVGSKE
jgi:hypothetical protein